MKINLLIVICFCCTQTLSAGNKVLYEPNASSVLTLEDCTSPVVTLHPSDDVLCEGEYVTFSADASGSPEPFIQWQVSYNYSTNWINLDGETSSVLTFEVNEFDDGTSYRAVFTNDCGSDVSGIAELTVNTLPTISCGDQLISKSNDPGTCGAVVDLSGKVTADGYPAPNIIFYIDGVGIIPSVYNFPVGLTTVRVDANSSCGVASCELYVTIFDDESPYADCKDATLFLDEKGEANLLPEDVDGGSYDNCPHYSLEVSKKVFTCEDLGINLVQLTIDDESNINNTDQCTANVTVLDEIPPVAKCKPAVAELDENGTAAIISADVDNGSYDNCFYLLNVSPSSFDCGDLGDNTVSLTITEYASGMSDLCQTTVSVVDKIPPAAVCNDISVYLGLNGLVNITADDIDGGSSDNCNIALKTAGQTVFDCDDVGDNQVTLSVTDGSNNTDQCTANVHVMQRPSSLTYNGDLAGQYSDEVHLSAILKDHMTGTPLTGKTVKFSIGMQSITAVTDAAGEAKTKMMLTQNPCNLASWTVKAEFEGDCPFLPAQDEKSFNYLPEDVENIEYTGTAIAATENINSNSFTVTLIGIISDKDDGFPGNISLAEARFLVDGSPVSDYLPVLLLLSDDPSIGVVEFDWPSALTDNPTTFDVSIELKNCYYEGTSAEFPLTVYYPEGDFITGGGFLSVDNTAEGIYKPDDDSKFNFGFNVKYNKKGRNLQGKMNMIFRRTETDGLHVYQIKSNATTSLGTNLDNPEELIAEFLSKANLTDVTISESPVEIAGNLTLHVTMTDKGEPGDNDKLAVTLYDGSPDALWVSSKWDVTHSVEKVIAGGNLVIHSGAAFDSEPEEDDPNVSHGKGNNKNKSATIESDMQLLKKQVELNIYPNPFSEQLTFEFESPVSTNASIEIIDLSGRKVKTIFERNIEAGVKYNAVFIPVSNVSNLYLYRMQLGREIFQGKVIYAK